jgi:hypothetical protein
VKFLKVRARRLIFFKKQKGRASESDKIAGKRQSPPGNRDEGRERGEAIFRSLKVKRSNWSNIKSLS